MKNNHSCSNPSLAGGGGDDSKPLIHVEKLIDVNNKELCYVIGTVFQDMPLKPSILKEISQDVSILTYIGFACCMAC